MMFERRRSGLRKFYRVWEWETSFGFFLLSFRTAGHQGRVRDLDAREHEGGMDGMAWHGMRVWSDGIRPALCPSLPLTTTPCISEICNEFRRERNQAVDLELAVSQTADASLLDAVLCRVKPAPPVLRVTDRGVLSPESV